VHTVRKRHTIVIGGLLLVASTLLRADTTPQTVPVSQSWTDIGLLTTNDDWSGVAGIIGHRGDGLTGSTGVDPQTVVADGTGTPVDVNANQTNPNTFTTGGVTEFHLANPVVALNGSGTARAPFLLITVDTAGRTGITVSYVLRDLDGSTDNAISPVALQFRVGTSGVFTNVPAGFVADASTGPGLATLVTPVSATLPPSAGNQPVLQIRIITTDAAGNDEWIGVDDISITSAGVVAPGVTLTQTDGSTSVAEGGAHDTYGLALDTTPAGPVVIQAVSDGQTELSTDGSTFSLSISLALSDTSPAVVTVRAVDDGLVETSPHTSVITHTIASSGDPAYSDALTPVPAVAVSIAENDFTLTPIHAIQGTGPASSLVGQVVSTQGIVTGRRSNGFFVQTPDASVDGDPATSEGLLIFTGSAPPAPAAIGNLVRVTGTVAEFVPSADPFSPPVTELTGPTVTALATGEPLPAPVTLTAADTSPSGGIDQLERFEGMRVAVGSLTVVGPTGGSINEANATSTSNGVFYGVITGLLRPFREPGIEVPDALPAGAPCCVPRFDANPERLRVDSDAQPGAAPIDVSVGAEVTGLVGPLDYAFRTYTILPDAASPPAVSGGAAPIVVPSPAAGDLIVASWNLQRFYDEVNDPSVSDAVLTASAFARRLAKASLAIRTVLRVPDVLAVVEVENLPTLQALATRINTDAVDAGLPDPAYAAYLVEGNDVGGIDVGFLVKASRVTVIDVVQEGKDATYINPANGQPALLNDRPPLVLRATVPRPGGGAFDVTVIANHLRSMTDIDDPVEGPRVRAKRQAQADFLAQLVQDRQASDPAERILVVGDLNAFEFNDGYADLVGTIRGAPAPADQVVTPGLDLVDPDLVDLLGLVDDDQRYSYVFDGSAQVLDHALANAALRRWVSRLTHARSNADFPEILRADGTRPERLSDHDAAVVYVALGTPRLSGRLVSRGADFVDLEIVNGGGGNARDVVLDQVSFRTLSGTGAVALQDALPMGLGDLAAGQSVTVRLHLTVPPTVTRFAITEGGSLEDAGGARLRFSIAQVGR
jgi:predicted extracellular nuclease